MKIKVSIIIGFLVFLTGCVGIIEEKNFSPSNKSASWYKDEMIANSKVCDSYGNKLVTNERRISRLMAWVNISED